MYIGQIKNNEEKKVKLNKIGKAFVSAGVVAQLVERLFRIQEAWGSTPHCSIFLLYV